MVYGDPKQFLYAWLGKKKQIPNYEFRQTGAKFRQRYICEVCFFVYALL